MNDIKTLAERAREAAKNAYAIYSNFHVGACLECEDGTLYTGHNIENASYGACMCAERVAIYKAVSEGKRKFKRIAIAGPDDRFTPPCGLCRQVMAEFVDKDFEIILVRGEETKRVLFGEMMPYVFELEV